MVYGIAYEVLFDGIAVVIAVCLESMFIRCQ